MSSNIDVKHTSQEEKIEKCLKMMKGKSDEHKFAGLLMISKLSIEEIEKKKKIQNEILQALGISFLLRLLQTKGKLLYVYCIFFE